MRLLTSITVAALFAAFAQPLVATPITVVNPSFEQPGAEIYANYGNWGLTSWTPSSPTTSIGVYPAASYIPSLYNNVPPDGNFVLAIYGTTAFVNQTTSHAFALNEEYTLSVYGGRRNPDAFPAGTEMRLYAGATLLKSATLADPGAGAYSPNTMTFGPTDPGYGATLGALGSNLKIELYSAAGGGEADFDNVQLSFELVPEPASLALLALGGLVVSRRRCA